jgi:integration host factor subunit beta
MRRRIGRRGGERPYGLRAFKGIHMATITKKDLIDLISEGCKLKRGTVKQVTQCFLDAIIAELGKGNRLEFRDLGVFESKQRAARVAQNPKTMERVPVPAKRTVKFKVGRLMKARMQEIAKQHASTASVAAGPVPVPSAHPTTASTASSITSNSSKA